MAAGPMASRAAARGDRNGTRRSLQRLLGDVRDSPVRERCREHLDIEGRNALISRGLGEGNGRRLMNSQQNQTHGINAPAPARDTLLTADQTVAATKTSAATPASLNRNRSSYLGKRNLVMLAAEVNPCAVLNTADRRRSASEFDLCYQRKAFTLPRTTSLTTID